VSASCSDQSLSYYQICTLNILLVRDVLRLTRLLKNLPFFPACVST